MYARSKKTGKGIIAIAQDLRGTCLVAQGSFSQDRQTGRLLFDVQPDTREVFHDLAKISGFLDENGTEYVDAELELFEPAPPCNRCQQTTSANDDYFEIDGVQVCENCRAKYEATIVIPEHIVRKLRVALAGPRNPAGHETLLDAVETMLTQLPDEPGQSPAPAAATNSTEPRNR